MKYPQGSAVYVYMNDINTTFFELIQVAIGTRICLYQTPSADEWGELYAMAMKQSLVGVCFAGVQKASPQPSPEGKGVFSMPVAVPSLVVVKLPE